MHGFLIGAVATGAHLSARTRRGRRMAWTAEDRRKYAPGRSPARSATSRGVVVTPRPGTAIRDDGAMAGGTRLELEERERLTALKAEGLSLRAIAARLGRAASTISRELRRNALPRGGYLPVHAEGCYLDRRQRPAVLERDERLGRFVRQRLLEGWTPEQVAGWLRR